MSANPAIWKTNLNNEWRLFNNSDYKLPITEPPKDEKATKETKPQQYSPFSFTKLKPMTKGSVVCTSRGYGLIQAFNEGKKTITVKIEGQIVDFAEDEVMNEVPLNVVFITNSLKTDEVIYIPISTTMSEVIEKLEASKTNEENCSSISLFFRGKELETSTETLEKLKIMPGSKLLGLVQPKKPLMVQRFTLFYPEWHLNGGNILGLSLSPSKPIRIIGVGVLKSAKGAMTADLFMCGGMSINGEIVATRNMTAGQGIDHKEVEKVMFGRPFLVKAGEYVTIYMKIIGQCISSYGSGGKAQMEGEGDVTLTFAMPTDMPDHLHSVSDGQFPEIYYYA